MARIHRAQVGDAELVALQDTWTRRPAASFFPGVAAGAWDAYREFMDAEGNLTLNMGAWLVRSGGRSVLVDTGIGGRPLPMAVQAQPALPQLLVEAGVPASAIDIVVFTHLHFDHTGWNTVEQGRRVTPLFPNARHVVQRREWEHWNASEERRTAAHHADALAPIERAGLLDLVEGEHAVTPEVVTVPTPGHTPGHVSFVIASGGERAYILGDAAHQPVQLSEPGWSPGADSDPAQSARSRQALFDRAEQERALIAGGHFPFPGLGRAARERGRRVFRTI